MTIVSQETLSHERMRGVGLDWSEPEILVLMRDDLRPKEMALHLPHRSRRAIYLKRHRLGVAQKYRKSS